MADPREPPAALAELVGIEKVYGNGVVALRGVDLTLATGEVHAIVGENGAGKSTLVKVLFGLEQPTAGEIRLAGRVVARHTPAAAIAAGIGMVHQHFQLVESLTAAENLVLGREPTTGPFLDRRSVDRAFEEVSDLLHVDIDPRTRVSELSVGDRQRLEILKALHGGARILILDEPTAVLTPQEADQLLGSVRALAEAGTGVVLITHKLREVFTAADQVTVLRAGERIWSRPRSGLTDESVATAMIGRAVALPAPDRATEVGPTVLTVRALSTGGPGRGHLRSVDLDVRGGEIVGVAGVEGNGQDELAEVIGGLRPPAAGSIALDGTDLGRLSPRQRRELGLAHVAADRMHRGAALGASLAENLVADRIRRRPFSRHRVVDRSAAAAEATRAIERYAIRASGPEARLDSLSGGNVQKVVVARELADDPRLVLAAHPTRGVDLGAVALIHSALLERRAGGAGVLLISSDLDEVRHLADRIVVMFEGRIVAEFDDPEGVDEAELGQAMAGVSA